MCNRIGNEYKTSNIEGGEYSYVQAAGSREKLIRALGYTPEHFKLDIRFENNGVVILVETKQNFVKEDEKQLREYLAEEKALQPNSKIVCILANTNDDKIRVWKSIIDDAHLLAEENALDSMEHYESLFEFSRQNDRETVLKNTYKLNETLNSKGIKEKLRSQFVGTSLLYIKDVLEKQGITIIDDTTKKQLRDFWGTLSSSQIRSGIGDTLTNLLNGSDNKTEKIRLLQKNVLEDQKVKSLNPKDWVDILDEIVGNICKYINTDSSEGQDILNLFFIAFNKYTGKEDKNQAFTPDHITNFMCRVTGVDKNKRVFDGTCGSGSFLVQAMVLELADCNRQKATKEEKDAMRETITKHHIYGIEIDENIYGLATTNMLIHSDGNSNVIRASLFESEAFIRKANPDIILMNPPYNGLFNDIPANIRIGSAGKKGEEQTKGFIFLKYLSDVVKKINEERESNKESKKEIKVAILLPVACAIGSSNLLKDVKKALLEDNTLEAVFTLPNEIFYPGASASACCMVFTLGRPHKNADGTVNKTFFGYYKADGHKKKKNLGRIEQFDENNNSIWKQIEEEWLDLYRNKTVKDGISAMQAVSGEDEWLCEAYMKTDYSKLSETDFQKTLNNYCGFLVKTGHYPSLRYKESQAPDLCVEKWKEFLLYDYFDVVPGKYHYPEEYEEGITPYYSASNENNGIGSYIDLPPDFEGNKIVTGKVGCTAFYAPTAFCATSDVNIFIPKFDMSSFVGLFIANVINFNENYKWAYGRQCRVGNSKRIIVKLPADSDGNPDWQFMEDYIKALPYGDRLEG